MEFEALILDREWFLGFKGSGMAREKYEEDSQGIGQSPGSPVFNQPLEAVAFVEAQGRGQPLKICLLKIRVSGIIIHGSRPANESTACKYGLSANYPR